MDTFLSIPMKMNGFGREKEGHQTVSIFSQQQQRTARFLKLLAEPRSIVDMSLNPADHFNPAGIENPFVLGPLIAGVTGITLIIIITLSIWIINSSVKSRSKVQSRSKILSSSTNPIPMSKDTNVTLDTVKKSPNQEGLSESPILENQFAIFMPDNLTSMTNLAYVPLPSSPKTAKVLPLVHLTHGGRIPKETTV